MGFYAASLQLDAYFSDDVCLHSYILLTNVVLMDMLGMLNTKNKLFSMPFFTHTVHLRDLFVGQNFYSIWHQDV